MKNSVSRPVPAGRVISHCAAGALLLTFSRFELQHIASDQEHRFDVLYKKRLVGYYVPDLIAFGKVIVDAKTIERITDEDRGKMINYLKVTQLRVGLILNFRHPRLEFQRIVR
jgi:GxxExxY protein